MTRRNNNTQELAQQDNAPATTGASPFALQQAGGALANIQGNAEVMQAIASIYVAKQFPRDLMEVGRRMREACALPSLAAAATYSYERGKQTVTGISIRLAEVLLSAFGNCEASWVEVSRRRDVAKRCGVSECVAWAFDLETNTKQKIAFSVPHWRDTKTGGYAVTDERDIYELCANMAARRRRACILAILPAWLKEDALLCVNETNARENAKVKVDELVRRMVDKFEKLGVSAEQLEAYFGHPLNQCTRPEIAKIGTTYNAIVDGVARVEDYFAPVPQEAVESEIGGEPAGDDAAGVPVDNNGGMFGEEM